MYKSVPTYKDEQWTETIFQTEEEFKEFLLLLIKEPGKYAFDETSFLFNKRC